MNTMIRLMVRIAGYLLLLILAALVLGRLLPSYQIAYESEVVRGQYDLFLLDVLHRVRFPLTNTPYSERQPAWSPDGQYLAFAADPNGFWDIYIMSMARPQDAPYQLTDENGRVMRPAWSPDGAWIAFDSTRDGNMELYMVALGGSVETLIGENIPVRDLERLTHVIGRDEAPTWSPNGDQIMFTTYRDSDREVHIMDLANRESTNLTHNLMHNEWAGAWSPDGTRLTFTSTDAVNGWEVFMMNLDEWDRAAETLPLRQITNVNGDVAEAVWSPDARYLAMEVYDTVNSRSLYMLRSDAENADYDDLMRLTFTASDDRHPAWRPIH